MRRRMKRLLASWTLSSVLFLFSWCLILFIASYSSISEKHYKGDGLNQKFEIHPISTHFLINGASKSKTDQNKDFFNVQTPTVSLTKSLVPTPRRRKYTRKNNTADNNQKITIAAVSCGVIKVEETLTMIKSAIIVALRFKLPFLKFHLFADNETLPGFKTEVKTMSEKISGRRLSFEYDIHPVEIPPSTETRQLESDAKLWPCGTQRLRFSTMGALSNVEKLLYVDSDVIFTRDLREIWSFFSIMNSSQHTALAQEHEIQSWAWYGAFSKTPFYPPYGLSSGVMLMNLPGQRRFGLEEKVLEYYRRYRKDLILVDQDILNIIFHFHPESVYVLPCAFNYRGSPHCLETGDCPSARASGIRVLHGNKPIRFEFPSFKAVYMSFKNVDFSEDIEEGLYKPLYQELMRLSENVYDYCDQLVQSMFPGGIK